MGTLATSLRRYRWPLFAIGWCAFAGGVGYASDSAALGMFLLLAGLPLGGLLALAIAYPDAVFVARWNYGPRRPYTGPHAHLIGLSGVVVGHAAGGVLVRLTEAEWPARLPPFAPRPPLGAAVQVETVADDILIVRHVAPPA